MSSVSINTATTQLLPKAQKPMVYMFPQWNYQEKNYIKRHCPLHLLMHLCCLRFCNANSSGAFIFASTRNYCKKINSNEGSWRPKTKHTSQTVHHYCNKRWTLRIHCTLKLFICQWNAASTSMEANSDSKTYNVLALFVGLTRKTDCKHNRHVH